MNSFKLNASTLAILIVGLLVGAIGFYTENSGFVAAGAIFLITGVILFIKQQRDKNLDGS